MASFVTTDTWKNWDRSGKSEFMKSCIQLLQDDGRTVIFEEDGRISSVCNHISLLIRKGINGHVRKESVVSCLQELSVIHNDVPALILDLLNMVDAYTSHSDSSSDDSTERSNFGYIVKECEKFLSDKLLKERLEIDTLQEFGVLKNKTFYSKFIKVKTKLFYKQRKFNLFREECEGFAKLVTELNQEFSEHVKYESLLDIVQSLIGCFNLDPNRVLDVILEGFENKPKDAKLFIPLIRSYMGDSKIICEILGSKYTFFRHTGCTVSSTLHILTAQLLQHGVICLNDIYPWLTPDDKSMQKDYEKCLKDARDYVKKLQIISISNKEESPEEPENITEKYNSNQKLGLCEALLLVGDWATAKTLIDRLPEKYAVNFQPIASALCNLLNIIIEPLYDTHCKLGPDIKRKPVPPHSSSLAPEQARAYMDLRKYAIPILITLGASLRYDTVLMCKIIRICKLAMSFYGIENYKSTLPAEDSLYYDILTLLDVTVLPSLSYLDCNCCIAEEIWTVLKLYPYQIRYCLYSRWKNETYSYYPELLKKRGDAEKQIKNIMKRVSKENVKPVGRLIGKLTHCSPSFLFDYVLVQIQVYNNLIHPVVDSLKYLTSLSYDVLGFCLVESLANADKKRVKHDSTSISTWLQSLSCFCGAVYKKYIIELTGLLQYIGNQLKAQKSLDLLILKEVVQKMAGVDAAEDLTMDQLNAMAGGELLKAEAGYFSQVRNTKKSSQRLKEAMAEQNLAVALCLLMAQQKYCVVFRETQKSHLKLVGKLSDQCQDTLVQFGTFLGSTLSVDEYISKLPSIQSMLLDYHVPSEVAFFLARPMFNHEIVLKYDQLRKADANYKKMPPSLKMQKYCEAVNEVMEPVHGSVIPLYPPKIWEDITPQFLCTFWSLTMYDLCVPEETYQQVINKAKQQSVAVLDANSNKGKKEQERFTNMVEKLQDEKKKQQEHVEKIMYRLKQEKDVWFLARAAKSAKNETITRFLQLCLFPRCTFTAIDALFCAKFVHTIHMLKTPNFSTLLCYDRLFCDVTYSITSCTENEAMRYGRFLYAMLETVMRWHKSKEVFEKECANYPGFVTKFRVSNQHADSLDNVGYENYRHVCHKWHYKLAKAMVTCLESRDYIQIRNALIILIKIIPFFPVLIKLSQFIEKKIEKVRDEEKNNRQDLFTLSSSYLGQLKQRMSSSMMLKEGEFHILFEKEKVNRNHENAKGDSNSAVHKHNGDKREDKDKTEDKPDREKKVISQSSDDAKLQAKDASTVVTLELIQPKDKVEKQYKEDSKEKHRKEEKHDEIDKEKEKLRRDRKDEKVASKEERQYREERYVEMVSPKEDVRYSSERQIDRYFEDRSSGHYYREAREDRDVCISGLSSNSPGNVGRHSQESEPDRDIKRRKLESSSSKNAKQVEYINKAEKKERTTKTKDKRDKLTEEERELRKERKIGKKRERVDEALVLALKRRRDEEKVKIVAHQNGEILEAPSHTRDKHRRSREISPYQRERSHDRVDTRDKHRRSSEGKRR